MWIIYRTCLHHQDLFVHMSEHGFPKSLWSKKGNDCMGSNSEIEGGETCPESSDALSLGSKHRTVNKATVWHSSIGQSLHLLKLSLNVVKRQGRGWCCTSWQHRGWEQDCFVVTLSESPGQSLLSFIISNQHSHIQSACSENSGSSTVPEWRYTLFSDNSAKSFKDILVVSSFSFGKSWVSLHSNKDQITRGSNKRTYATCNKWAVSSLPCREILTFVYVALDMVSQVEVNTQSQSCVYSLSQKSRVKSTSYIIINIITPYRIPWLLPHFCRCPWRYWKGKGFRPLPHFWLEFWPWSYPWVESKIWEILDLTQDVASIPDRPPMRKFLAISKLPM